MKFIFYKDGNVIQCFSGFEEIIDIIPKPNARIVKILYKDGGIKEYYMISREAKMVHDLDVDIEEFTVKYYVEDLKK